MPSCPFSSSSSSSNAMTHEIPTTMKAITYAQTGSADVLELAPSLLVPTPSPSDILIKVIYSGLNSIDLAFRRGIYPLPKLPHVAGMEASGIVVKLPTDPAVLSHPEFKKRNLRVGSRVATVRLHLMLIVSLSCSHTTLGTALQASCPCRVHVCIMDTRSSCP